MTGLDALYIFIAFATGLWLGAQIKTIVWQDKSILKPKAKVSKEPKPEVKKKTRIRSINPYPTTNTRNNSGKD